MYMYNQNIWYYAFVEIEKGPYTNELDKDFLYKPF